MHENIKYTINLSEETVPFDSFDDLEPAATDLEAKKRIGDWQCLFSDHRYGTQYMVYGKFIGNMVSGGFHASQLQLYLQNYSGAVSMGFHLSKYTTIISETVGFGDHDYDPRYPNRKRYKLRFALQGMVDSKDRWLIPNAINDELIIRSGDVLESQAVLTPIDPSLTKIFEGEEAMKTAAFVDPEFMDRLGEDVFVTLDNMERLYDLNNENPDLVPSTDLIRGFGIDPAENVKALDTLTSIKGRPNPCIPVFSIFKIS